jgi:hypothetical protein
VPTMNRSGTLTTVPTPRIPSTGGSVSRRLALASVIATASIMSFAPSGVAVAADPTESPTPGLTMQEARVGHTATLLADGSVLIAGSIDADGTVGSAELYGPDRRRFEPTGSLGQARIAHTATLLADGRVLLLGGWGQELRATAESYDPVSGEFSPGARLGKARAFHTATLLEDGRLLVAGGAGTTTGATPLASAELYDPVTERSAPVGPLKKARVYHTATRLEDGRVLIVGGLTKRSRSLASAELYDPATERITSVGPLAHARLQHTATRLDDGHVLVIGGVTPDAGPVLTAELYDPSSQRFESVGSLTRARVGHTSTLLDDGRVLVIGGGGNERASMEVYDPVTGSFTDGGSLHSARYGHRATRLDDGTVLIAGGSGAAWPTDSAELFDPVTMRVIAYGPVDPSASGPWAAPSLPPLPLLGKTLGGGRIEVTGSGFAMTFPDDWIVEVVDPDPDVFSAAPGTAWEALRAHDPGLQRACSVSVGVATRSLKNRSGVASGSATTVPSWDEDEQTLLWVPDPRLESTTAGVSTTMAPRERLHKRDPRLEHDVMYAVSCSAAGDDESETLELALDRLTETFELLPSKG